MGLRVLTFLAIAGSGLIAGVFFAFSTFVMKALSRIPAEQGINAMKSINIVVINPLFMAAFMGTAAICLVLGISAINGLIRGGSAAAGFLLTACLLYLIGTFLVTMVGNVPLNDRLATTDATSAASAEFWKQYLTGWMFWNHVRTLGALAAMICFLIAGGWKFTAEAEMLSQTNAAAPNDRISAP